MTVNQVIKAGLAGSIVAITAGVIFIAMLKGDESTATLGAVLPTVLTCLALVYHDSFRSGESRSPEKPADPSKQ